MNLKKYIEIVKQTQEELKESTFNFLDEHYKSVFKSDGFVYAIGNIPVLLVAHLDTVHREPPRNIWMSFDCDKIKADEGIGGDDRNGVFLIEEIVDRLGKENIQPYVLFTEDEEIGGIGADLFTSAKFRPELNYIIELDRRGSTDAVFYDCDNPDFTDFVESFGFKEEFGSFSDISTVAPDMGVAAVNLSSGYYNAHTKDEYIVMSEMDEILEKTIKMIKAYPENKFEYIEVKYTYESYGLYSGYYGSTYKNNKVQSYKIKHPDICEYCGFAYADGQDEAGIPVCKDCARSADMVQCEMCRDFVYKDTAKKINGFTICKWCSQELDK